MGYTTLEEFMNWVGYERVGATEVYRPIDSYDKPSTYISANDLTYKTHHSFIFRVYHNLEEVGEFEMRKLCKKTFKKGVFRCLL